MRLKLTIDIPSLQEAYYGSWNARGEEKDSADRVWKVCHPLLVEGRVVGQLEMAGIASTDSTLGHVIQVLDFLEPIEEDIRQIMEEIQHGQSDIKVGQSSSSFLKRTLVDKQSSPGESLAKRAGLTGQQPIVNG